MSSNVQFVHTNMTRNHTMLIGREADVLHATRPLEAMDCMCSLALSSRFLVSQKMCTN